eukprot:g3716.t1
MAVDRFLDDHWERSPVLVSRNQSRNGDGDAEPDYYGGIYSMENISAIMDSFADQRLHDDFVIVKEGFVTPKSFNRLNESYPAYLAGYTTSLFIINRLWHPVGKVCADLGADLGFPFRGRKLEDLAKAGDDMAGFTELAKASKHGLILYWYMVRAFVAACIHGKLHIVRYMMDQGFDIKETAVRDVLFKIVQKGRKESSVVEVLQHLVACGLEPNLQLRPKFLTPLHHACERGWFEMVDMLIRLGADVNAVADDDVMPLHCAEHALQWAAVPWVMPPPDGANPLDSKEGAAQVAAAAAEVSAAVKASAAAAAKGAADKEEDGAGETKSEGTKGLLGAAAAAGAAAEPSARNALDVSESEQIVALLLRKGAKKTWRTTTTSSSSGGSSVSFATYSGGTATSSSGGGSSSSSSSSSSGGGGGRPVFVTAAGGGVTGGATGGVKYATAAGGGATGGLEFSTAAGAAAAAAAAAEEEEEEEEEEAAGVSTSLPAMIRRAGGLQFSTASTATTIYATASGGGDDGEGGGEEEGGAPGKKAADGSRDFGGEGTPGWRDEVVPPSSVSSSGGRLQVTGASAASLADKLASGTMDIGQATTMMAALLNSGGGAAAAAQAED